MVKIFCLWVVMCLPMFGGPMSATGRVPLRPADGIYDEGGWLEVGERAEMVRQILGARDKGDTAVFVVILDEKPDDAGAFAQRVGREWGKGGLWGLVLHVVGEPEFPKFYAELSRLPGWSDEQKNDFKDSVDRALVKAAKQTVNLGDARQRVESGTREMADELGYLALVMAKIDSTNAQARGDRLDEETTKESGPSPFGWVLMIGVPALVVVVFLLLYLIFKEDHESGDGFLFPETEPRRRFRAPWCGGGNVLVDFRRQERKGRGSRRKF